MNGNQQTFTDFSSFTRRLTLTGTLQVETALRVGTGLADELSGADIAVIKDDQRRPFIPGSSFKGALRAHIERLVRGLWPEEDTRLAACDPLTDATRCLPNTKMQELRDEAGGDPAQLAKKVWANSCHLCRVFGSPWLASKTLVKDLTLKHPQFWFEGGYQVRTGVSIERDSDTAHEGMLYSTETVPPGTEFTWEIMLENADPVTEEPLVILGLREMINRQVLLGGAKSRGLGRVALTVDGATMVDKATLVDYLINQKSEPVEWATLEQAIPILVRKLAGRAENQSEESHA